MQSLDFGPSASLENLRRRAELLTELRAFFFNDGYWEVQTPILSRDCCIDAWIDPYTVALGSGEIGYLQTSPEFALKRLICAGADKIYEVARVFRQEERGPCHNPEFTMVEWYARNEDHHAQMDFVERLIRHLLAGRIQGAEQAALAATSTITRMTYEAAFLQFSGVSPASASLAELAAAAVRTTSPLPAGIESDRDGLLNLILADQVEPELQKLGAVFLYDYPASQAALARIREDVVPVAERFELYLNGIEICNGYHELTDPVEQLQRMQYQNQKRVAAGKPAIADDSRLIQAMQMQPLPPSSGVALGFDRLVMWCLNCSSIQDVLAFPIDRA